MPDSNSAGPRTGRPPQTFGTDPPVADLPALGGESRRHVLLPVGPQPTHPGVGERPELTARWTDAGGGALALRWSRTPPVDLDEAYDLCELITREQAHNLYYAIRPLPAYKRRALCAIYAFARRVDDIADGDLPPARKLELLAVARTAIRGRSREPVAAAVRDSVRAFSLPARSLEDLLDGVERDVHGVRHETFLDLVQYCRLVAGSIGRLLVCVLGSEYPVLAARLADDLGVAMQLTNILRDVVEDFERGRVYLPLEDLARFGCTRDLRAGPASAVYELIRYQAVRNGAWYTRGPALLSLLDPRGAACVAAMIGIYECILGRIERAPEEVLAGRISLTHADKVRIATRALAAAGPESRDGRFGPSADGRDRRRRDASA